MGVSYGVKYDCTISGSRKDLEQIPTFVLRVSRCDQAWWSMQKKEQKHYLLLTRPHLIGVEKSILEKLALGAEKALVSGGPPAFEFTADEDDGSHGIMEKIINALDKALPGLAIIVSACRDAAHIEDYLDEDEEECFDEDDVLLYSYFISPPGQSSLDFSERGLFSLRDDWDEGVFQECTALTCLRLPEDTDRVTIYYDDFKGCVGLTDIIIPETIEEIDEVEVDDTPFRDCKNLTVHAPAGSYAEEYAKERGISFKALN